MKNWILSGCFSLLLINLALAQYEGGNGDGHQRGNVFQVNLDGIPQGTFPLYQGGMGDGHTRGSLSAWLSGDLPSQLYSGGYGDGHARTLTPVAIAGASLVGLYAGGNGDGHARILHFSLLDGTPASALYAGGNGDGHDAAHTQSFIGVSSAVMYTGGGGDGHDVKLVQALIEAGSLAMMYSGGDGDGHDVENLLQSAIPFPVTLLSFDAFPMETFVLLQWVTEREENSSFFTVEKTRDGMFFMPVTDVPAAGFSDMPLPYETVDPEPFEGQSFYRLKSTDLDGAFSYSHLVEVHFSSPDGWDFVLYPNPNSGERIMLDVSGLGEGNKFSVEILDIQGRIIATGEEVMPSAGNFSYTLDLGQRLPAGTYLVRVKSEAKGTAAKLLLVR